MFYTYVLESKKDGKRYIGFMSNLKKRLEEHAKGYSFATAFRRPFTLIYCEVCTNEKDARRREGYLKTSGGNKFLARRLCEYYKLRL